MNPLMHGRLAYWIGVLARRRASRTIASVGRDWRVNTTRPIIATSCATFEYANVRMHALHACFPLVRLIVVHVQCRRHWPTRKTDRLDRFNPFISLVVEKFSEWKDDLYLHISIAFFNEQIVTRYLIHYILTRIFRNVFCFNIFGERLIRSSAPFSFNGMSYTIFTTVYVLSASDSGRSVCGNTALRVYRPSIYICYICTIHDHNPLHIAPFENIDHYI